MQTKLKSAPRLILKSHFSLVSPNSLDKCLELLKTKPLDNDDWFTKTTISQVVKSNSSIHFLLRMSGYRWGLHFVGEVGENADKLSCRVQGYTGVSVFGLTFSMLLLAIIHGYFVIQFPVLSSLILAIYLTLCAVVVVLSFIGVRFRKGDLEDKIRYIFA